MKKILVCLLCLMLFISNVHAVSATDKKFNISDYETMNFTEILESEGIEPVFKEYKESDDQTVIYLFRGNGCGYCRAFLTFLNSITDEYGKYFKVVGFEVWSNKDNSNLLDKVSAFLDSPAGGVPYIIIGEQVFPGYAESYDDAIKKAIMDEYEKDEKVNVFDEYNKAIDVAKKAANGNAPTIIFWHALFVLCATVVEIFYIKSQNKKIFNMLNELSERNGIKKYDKKH